MSIKAKNAFLFAASTLALASAAMAADLPAGASGKAVAASDTVHCYNVNSCKGQSDCKTTENSCKGQNVCKGHGFKAQSAKACLASGGVIGDL